MVVCVTQYALQGFGAPVEVILKVIPSEPRLLQFPLRCPLIEMHLT